MIKKFYLFTIKVSTVKSTKKIEIADPMILIKSIVKLGATGSSSTIIGAYKVYKCVKISQASCQETKICAVMLHINLFFLLNVIQLHLS